MRLVFALLIILFGPCRFAFALEVSGVPQVSDADTVTIEHVTIRLLGIDAPESNQVCLDANGQAWSCGVTARSSLVAHVGTQVWHCNGNDKDRYGRLLATCFVGKEDIDRWLVEAGWALSFVHYSHTYDDDEKAARDARRGLWSGAFIAPWEWRDRNCKTTILGAVSVPIDAQRKLCGSPDVPPEAGCDIKANMRPSKSARCIYHLPGTHGYGKLSMDKPGRRWFCSEGEAQASGCRKAMR